jgi:predicted component of type VI protein secretion system
MVVTLRVLNPGKWQAKTFPIAEFPFLIGRSSNCQLRLKSSLVGERHCALVLSNGKLVVRDLGSGMGTLLNGRRVKKVAELGHLQRLSVGPILFEVLLQAPDSNEEVKDSSPPETGDDTIEEQAAAILLEPNRDDLLLDNDSGLFGQPATPGRESASRPEIPRTGHTSVSSRDLLTKLQRPRKR